MAVKTHKRDREREREKERSMRHVGSALRERERVREAQTLNSDS